jgi:CelD/BcsL family acetyltransferase involved in cellulose biosynthesis
VIPGAGRAARPAVRLRRFIGHAAANILDVEEVTTSEGLASLAPAWDGLVERSDIDHPFLSHAWIRTFWEAFGEPGQLCVLVVRRHGQVVAIAPLVRRTRTMYGIAARTIETIRNPHSPRSDLILSAHPTEACGAILAHLVARRGSWDVLELGNLPETSVAYRDVRRIARVAGLLTGTESLGGSPFVPRPTDWDAYMRTLSAKHRSNLRNRLGRLGRQGDVALETVAAGEDLEAALKDVFRLEASGWKRNVGTAISSEASTEDFYRALARRAAARGWLRLEFLTVGGRRIAAIYALRYGGRHYIVKLGYDPEFASCAPGHLACMLSLEHAFAEGAVEVDFLGDDDPWKRDWTSEVRAHRWLFVFPDHFRARCLYLAKFGVVPRLKRSGLLRALRDAMARDEEPR